MTDHAARVCVITNPRGGRGEIDLAPVLPVLAAHGWEVEVRRKRRGGDATKLSREAIDDGFDVIVAAGGDGTVGEVVDGAAGSDIAVGVLPGGTANLWAHEIGMSMDLGAAALQLVGAQRRRIDVGHVAINGGAGQHFLLMAGLGIDAAVLTRLNKSLKKKTGLLAYVPAIIRALPRAKPFRARIDLDGVAWDGEVVQIVVGNTRRYAEVTSATPGAVADDGRLDVCLLTPTNLASGFDQLATLVLRQHPNPRTSINDRVARLTVRTSAVVPLQTDGGRVKQDEVEPGADGVTYVFSVKTRALTVLVPRDYSGDLFQAPPAAMESAESARPRGKRWHRVIAVGVDAITAARVTDGAVRSIELRRGARLKGADGKRRSRAAFLAGLTPGALIRVRGKKNRRRGVVVARSVKLAKR